MRRGRGANIRPPGTIGPAIIAGHMEIAFLISAFGFGLLARLGGLPPLVGYLVAGFVLHAFGYAATEAIDLISEVGILLLLFVLIEISNSTMCRSAVDDAGRLFAA